MLRFTPFSIAMLSLAFCISGCSSDDKSDVKESEVVADDKFESPEEELAFLNAQISELEAERDRYLARAVQAKNQGDRLQFQSGRVYEARRYWKIAKVSNDIAKRIDLQIKELKAQRQPLLDRGIKPAPTSMPDNG